MLHELILLWFTWVRDWGFWGVFILMALESTIIPVPSELVLPPAAYWASQGHMSFSSVVIAGTLGSYFGSSLSYWISRWLGQPFVIKYGHYILLSQKKFKAAEAWLNRFGAFGVFLARLLPVIRHLISIPAGIFKMNFKVFSFVTLTGSALWSFVLSYFGAATLGKHPDLLDSPETMASAIKQDLIWFVLGILALTALYFIFIYFKSRKPPYNPVD